MVRIGTYLSFSIKPHVMLLRPCIGFSELCAIALVHIGTGRNIAYVVGAMSSMIRIEKERSIFLLLCG